MAHQPARPFIMAIVARISQELRRVKKTDISFFTKVKVEKKEARTIGKFLIGRENEQFFSFKSAPGNPKLKYGSIDKGLAKGRRICRKLS